MISSVDMFKKQVLSELKTNITKELFLDIQNAKDKKEIVDILSNYEQHLKDIQQYKQVNVLYYIKNIYTKILLEILVKKFLCNIEYNNKEYPLFYISSGNIKSLWFNNMKYLLPNICNNSNLDYYSYFHISKEKVLIPKNSIHFHYDYENFYLLQPINKGE